MALHRNVGEYAIIADHKQVNTLEFRHFCTKTTIGRQTAAPVFTTFNFVGRAVQNNMGIEGGRSGSAFHVFP